MLLPPEARIVFFVDACMGRYVVANALRKAGAEVIAHDERFEPGTTDEEWLAEAGRLRWIVLTKDQRIRYRENELHALRKAGVRAFVVIGKNLTGEQIANALVAALP
ncbi:MAG: hypothetical protein L0Z55_00210, partial [Planctomycetes bacterium]|nr:hypothetical protein [Planctomycetota bacterium]